MAVACRAALAKARGAIVNIASMHAIFGAPLSPAYAASKAGVVQLTKSLAVAWAEDGIRVNAIAPGWIETPMTVPARSDAARNRAILERTPLGRWGTPDDIVGPALFLASDAARFITGAVLPVDGGYSVKYFQDRAGSLTRPPGVCPPGRTHMPAPEADANSRVAYRQPQPAEMAPDLVVAPVLPADERIWVPQAPNVWFRPLCLSVSQGYWVNLLKVTRAGVLSRHRHTNPVHGYVLKGRWHYLEHDWVAEEGGYVYEPPGETHTLVVPEDVDEMITLFQVNGIMLYVDPDGRALGYEDVFSKIAMCRTHYEACGLGADYVERFIR